MRIAIGMDHGGYELRAAITETLQQLGHAIVDQGASEYLATDDYPDSRDCRWPGDSGGPG